MTAYVERCKGVGRPAPYVERGSGMTNREQLKAFIQGLTDEQIKLIYARLPEIMRQLAAEKK